MKDRIKKIMDYEDLSAARFADRLDINRAVISHILNGRNNPSLDVVTKILTEMNYINPDWLLSGVGLMFKEGLEKEVEKERSLFAQDEIDEGNSTEEAEYAAEKRLRGEDKSPKPAEGVDNKPISVSERKVKQIIVYYDDNTFETFTPH